jgi:hypothetical protein
MMEIGMRTIKCPLCKTNQSLAHYKKDDPVLSCGHIITLKLLEPTEEIRDGLYRALRDEIYDIMRKQKICLKEALKLFWNKPT